MRYAVLVTNYIVIVEKPTDDDPNLHTFILISSFNKSYYDYPTAVFKSKRYMLYIVLLIFKACEKRLMLLSEPTVAVKILLIMSAAYFSNIEL